MAVNLTNFYLHVVADVVNNVRADFIHEGIDETVLTELQSLWELNMMQSGAIQGPLGGETMYSRNDVSSHVHDLNVPYGGETPTADLIFAQTPVHTPSSATQVPFSHFMGPGPSPSDHPELFEVATGRPSEYTHASAWGNHKLEVGLDTSTKIDMNIAYDGGDGEHALNAEYRGPQEFLPSSTGKRKREDITTNFQSGEYFPQLDGAADFSTLVVEKGSTNLQDLSSSKAEKNSRKDGNQCSSSTQLKINYDVAQALVNSCQNNPRCSIPQLDGIGDHYDDSVAEEDYNEPGDEGEEQFSIHEAIKPEGVDPEMLEPPLNEDDDLADDLDDIDQTEGDSKTENLVLAQFEKANGEFEF